jgi:hypothetical protein
MYANKRSSSFLVFLHIFIKNYFNKIFLEPSLARYSDYNPLKQMSSNSENAARAEVYMHFNDSLKNENQKLN